MPCPIERGRGTEALLDFCARRLSSVDALAIARHLENCSDCRAFVASQEPLWDALDEWDAPADSAGFDSRLFAAIQASETRSWAARITSWVRFAWKPAIPVALAATAAVTLFVIPKPAVVRSPVVQPALVEVVDANQAEQVEQTLEDLNMLNQLEPGPTTREL